MNFQQVKNLGLSLLVLILLLFAVLGHIEGRLYNQSITNMDEVYHPLLHRIGKLNTRLQSTDGNFDNFHSRDVPLIRDSIEIINNLANNLDSIAATAANVDKEALTSLKTRSRVALSTWSKLETIWQHNRVRSNDVLELNLVSFRASLQETKRQLSILNASNADEAVSRLIINALSETISLANNIDAFLLNKPVLIEKEIDSLKYVNTALVEFQNNPHLVDLERTVVSHAHSASMNMESHNGHTMSDDSEHMAVYGHAKHASLANSTDTIQTITENTSLKVGNLQEAFRVIASSTAFNSTEFEHAEKRAMSLVPEIQHQLDLLEDRLNHIINADNQILFNRLERYRTMSHSVTVLGFGLALLVSLLMSRRINHLVQLVTDGTHLLAQGELDHRIPQTGKDQLGQISTAFNSMAEKLRVREFERNNLMAEIDRSAQEAARANAAKSDFMASMSHEIRTPINGVLGTAELLAREPLSRSQLHLTETIQRSGNALLQIINDILDFSKIEAGGMALEKEPFDMRELIEDIGEMAAPSAHAKGLEISYVVDSKAAGFFLGDALRIRQILTNLVSNAIKFTNEGEVVIVASGTEVSEHNCQLTISVSDTGIGMNEEAQSRIFQPFSQASRSTTRKYGGTGLGLSISLQLTQMMGGELSLSSHAGEGSEFKLALTLTKSSNTTEPPSLECKPDSVCVLLVSNHAPTKQAITNQLALIGLNAFELSSAQETIEFLAEQPNSRAEQIELLIIDRQLRDMSGIEFLRLIKQQQPALQSRRKVKLCLVNEIEIDKQQSADLGIEYLLNKPVRQSALFDCLAGLIGHTESAAAFNTQPIMDQQFNANVLLVEDHPINQDIVTRMLTSMGCKVTVAENGEIGLTYLQRQAFDIVFMDCDMPVMDGFTATKRYREFESANDLGFKQTIVALTANALDGDRKRCLSAGMDDYLSKPLRMGELSSILATYLNTENSNETEGVASGMQQIEQDAGNGNPDLIDTETVEQLLSMNEAGSSQFFNELLQSFLNNWQIDSRTLSDAINAAELDKVRSTAHRLKSASATMGALRLSSLASNIESAAKANDLTLCSVSAEMLPKTLDDSVTEFNKYTQRAA